MDVLCQSVTGIGSRAGSIIGLGAQVGRVAALLTQGGLDTTNSPTDIAIQGSGYFVVSDGEAQLYTRAGNFNLDADGQLVTPTGHRVQGYSKDPVTGVIDVNAKLSTIKIPSMGNSVATSEFELIFQPGCSAAVGSTFSTTLQVFDSLGEVHLATVDFVKDSVTATGSDWKFDITLPHKEFFGVAPTSTNKFSLFTGAIATTPPGAGTLVFDNNGKLTSVYVGATPGTLPPVANLQVPPTGVTIPTFNNSAILNSGGISWNLLDENGDSNATALSTESNVT